MSESSYYLAVRIDLDDSLPIASELENRNNVEEALDAYRLGKCLGAGVGMGQMDFGYEVDDVPAAKAAIQSIMRLYFPNRAYTIDVSDVEPEPTPNSSLDLNR